MSISIDSFKNTFQIGNNDQCNTPSAPAAPPRFAGNTGQRGHEPTTASASAAQKDIFAMSASPDLFADRLWLRLSADAIVQQPICSTPLLAATPPLATVFPANTSAGLQPPLAISSR